MNLPFQAADVLYVGKKSMYVGHIRMRMRKIVDLGDN